MTPSAQHRRGAPGHEREHDEPETAVAGSTPRVWLSTSSAASTSAQAAPTPARTLLRSCSASATQGQKPSRK